MESKFVRPDEVPYLQVDQIVTAFSDVILACSDGVRVQTTRLHLAALSQFMRLVLASHIEGEPSIIHTESHSDDVTRLILFLMTGCIVSPSPFQDNQIPESLLSTFEEFGIAVRELQLLPLEGQKWLPNVEGLIDSMTVKPVDQEEESLAQRRSLRKPKKRPIRMPQVVLSKLEDELPFTEAIKHEVFENYENFDGYAYENLFDYDIGADTFDGESATLAKSVNGTSKRAKRTKKEEDPDYTETEDFVNVGSKRKRIKREEEDPDYNEVDNNEEEEEEDDDETYDPDVDTKKKKKAGRPKGSKNGKKVKDENEPPLKKKKKKKGKGQDTLANFFYFPQKGEFDRTKPFQCTKCVRKFDNEIDFKVHVKRHNRENNRQAYFCISCDEAVFEHLKDFSKHREECEDESWGPDGKRYRQESKHSIFHFPQTEAEDKSFRHRCSLCIRMFYQRARFEQHLRRHLSNKTPSQAFSCVFCNNKTFRYEHDMWEHIKTCQHQPETHKPMPPELRELYERHNLFDPKYKNGERGTFFCNVCGEKSTTQMGLRHHTKRMGPFHIDKCVQCDYVFISWDDHQDHVNNVHNGEMKYQCGLCGEIFPTAHLHKHHRQSKHRAGAKSTTAVRELVKFQVCEVCGKSISKPHYQNHLAIVHGIGGKNLKCSLCPKVFATEYVLTKHFQSHTKSYTCDICGHASATAHKLKKHFQSKHTADEDKPFKCTQCPKGFTKASVLEEHMNIHLNLRPHKCPHCTSDFNSIGNLYAHIRGTHKGIKRVK